MSWNGLYLRPHLVFYPWTDRLPEEEMLISPFASGQLAFQHLCNCHIFLNIWDDIVVPIVKYQVSNSCLSASKLLRLIKGKHLWVVTMMIKMVICGFSGFSEAKTCGCEWTPWKLWFWFVVCLPCLCCGNIKCEEEAKSCRLQSISGSCQRKELWLRVGEAW